MAVCLPGLTLALAVLWAAVHAAAAQNSSAQPLGPWVQGFANSYGAWASRQQAVSQALKLGACGYAPPDSGTWPGYSTMALAPTSALAAALPQGGCGACFEVQCGGDPALQGSCVAPGASVVVTVTDACPACDPTLVSLHPLAFARMANLSRGGVPVRYRQVACRPPGPLEVTVSEYDVLPGGSLRLHLSQVAGTGGITAAFARSSPSDEGALAPQWQQLSNGTGMDATWSLFQPPPPPLDILAYDGQGQPILARSAIPTAGATGTFSTSVQFTNDVSPFPPDGGTITPASEPAPEPLEPAPAVEPQTMPAAGAALTPAMEPALEPAPEAAPTPAAEASLEPAPEAALTPAMEPALEPAPEAAPVPAAEGAPVPAGEAGGQAPVMVEPSSASRDVGDPPPASPDDSGDSGTDTVTIIGLAVGLGVPLALLLAAAAWLACRGCACGGSRASAGKAGGDPDRSAGSDLSSAKGGAGGYYGWDKDGHPQYLEMAELGTIAGARPWDPSHLPPAAPVNSPADLTPVRPAGGPAPAAPAAESASDEVTPSAPADMPPAPPPLASHRLMGTAASDVFATRDNLLFAMDPRSDDPVMDSVLSTGAGYGGGALSSLHDTRDGLLDAFERQHRHRPTPLVASPPAAAARPASASRVARLNTSERTALYERALVATMEEEEAGPASAVTPRVRPNSGPVSQWGSLQGAGELPPPPPPAPAAPDSLTPPVTAERQDGFAAGMGTPSAVADLSARFEGLMLARQGSGQSGYGLTPAEWPTAGRLSRESGGAGGGLSRQSSLLSSDLRAAGLGGTPRAGSALTSYTDALSRQTTLNSANWATQLTDPAPVPALPEAEAQGETEEGPDRGALPPAAGDGHPAGLAQGLGSWAVLQGGEEEGTPPSATLEAPPAGDGGSSSARARLDRTLPSGGEHKLRPRALQYTFEPSPSPPHSQAPLATSLAASDLSVNSAAPLVGAAGRGEEAPEAPAGPPGGVLRAADAALAGVLRYSGRAVYHPTWRNA